MSLNNSKALKSFKGDCHGSVHVVAVTNVKVYKPIGSDVIIRAGNLHVRVKIFYRSVICKVNCP